MQMAHIQHLERRAGYYASQLDCFANPSGKNYALPEVWSVWFTNFAAIPDSAAVMHFKTFDVNRGRPLRDGRNIVFIDFNRSEQIDKATYGGLSSLCNVLDKKATVDRRDGLAMRIAERVKTYSDKISKEEIFMNADQRDLKGMHDASVAGYINKGLIKGREEGRVEQIYDNMISLLEIAIKTNGDRRLLLTQLKAIGVTAEMLGKLLVQRPDLYNWLTK